MEIAGGFLCTWVFFPGSRRVPFQSVSARSPPGVENRGNGEQPGASLPL